MSRVSWYRPESWRFAKSSLDDPSDVAGDLRAPDWVIWDPRQDPVEVTATNGGQLLDAFCRIARSDEAWPRQRRAATRRRLEAMTAFLEASGPWAYCRDGHLHGRYEARMADGVPRKAPTSPSLPTSDRRAPEVVLTDDRGVPWMALDPISGKPGRFRRPIGAQWLPDLGASAVRVNALRAIITNVSRGTVADAALWDRLLDGQPRLRASIQVATLVDQKVAAERLVLRWLVAEHVELDEAGNGYASGPAGALALALRDESETKAGSIGVCGRCEVTWRIGRRRDGGGIPALCKRCAGYERLNEWRSTARAKTRASST